MQLDVGITFFLLGVFATLVRSKIEFPKGLYQSLILFLMIAIGLKGGIALAEHASLQLLWQSLLVVSFGFLLPLIAFPLLYHFGQLSKTDSASIAAHYGSVSVGTYAVAIAVLEAQNIAYEAYIALFLVLLEIPAIITGIFLAKRSKQAQANPELAKKERGKLLHEIFFNQGIVLMVGGLFIGFIAGENITKITPFFFDLFNGILALFLLHMGIMAAKRLDEIKRLGSFLLAFGVAMPMIGGSLGSLLGLAIGLSDGGAILLAVLGGSASYIAVPAAMRVVLPEANESLSISASLGITFPFNVLIGIPTFIFLTQWLSGFNL